MNELAERIQKITHIEDTDEAIAIIEDELDDIITSIFNEPGFNPEATMEGNATMLAAVKNGYLLKKDNGDVMFLYKNSYKGIHTEKGTRVRYGLTSKKGDKEYCKDAMECLSYNEMKFQMFSHIEDRDMLKAATYAWAIYDKASQENREAMRFCIHSLRNFVKRRGLKKAA